MTSKSQTRQKAGWILIGAGALLAIRMSANIWKVYRSGGRIGQAQIELDQALKEQETLKKNLAQVQTPEFIEKEAREKLGMGRPGEVVLIMPKFGSKPQIDQEPNLANWQKWWKLYVGI